MSLYSFIHLHYWKEDIKTKQSCHMKPVLSFHHKKNLILLFPFFIRFQIFLYVLQKIMFLPVDSYHQKQSDYKCTVQLNNWK